MEPAMIRKAIAVTLFLGVVPFTLAQTVTPSSVPAARLARIRHGINLSGCFAQVYGPAGYSKEHLQNGETPADMALIKSAGFDHVRLSINPLPIMDAARHHDGAAEYFGYLDAAVRIILDAGL